MTLYIREAEELYGYGDIKAKFYYKMSVILECI